MNTVFTESSREEGGTAGGTGFTRSHGDQPSAGAGAWWILAVLLAFSVAAPLNQFKVPPILPILMDALGLSVSRAGLLMSVYSITGLVLALPAGLIYQKAGARATGLLAGGSILAGVVLGAIGGGTGVLLVSRVIEGTGTSFMAVLVPAVISQRFDARRRGTAIGIWTAWVPIGAAFMMIVAPAFAQAWGWRSVWWLGAGYAMASTFLFMANVKPVDTTDRAASLILEGTSGKVMRNRDIWLLALAFAGLNMATTGLSTYLPTFLASVRGLSLARAALLSSISTFIVIFSAPAGGFLSDRIGSRKLLYLVGFAATAILLPLSGMLHGSWLIFLFIIQGLVLGIIPTNIFAGAVEAARDERFGGAAMAVIMVGQNAGMLLGPVIFGTLADTAGWPAAFMSLFVTSTIGLMAGWLAKVR